MRSLLLCSLLTGACYSAAAAQTTIPAVSPALSAQDSDVAATGLEEIVVTARRREESLQSVPIAVTALSSASLESKQITDVAALQQAVPNLYIAPFGDASTAIVAIRGLVATDNVSTIDPAVGIYQDGTYIARSTGGNLNFIDVDRVEVLRGPQGTLFGRNTIGGAISITTTKPTDKLEGSVRIGYGNYDAWKLTGVINLPVMDGVSVRLVGQHSERGGFARSSITGAELSAENIDYVRGAVSFDIAPDWNVLVQGDYTHSRNNGQWITLIKTFPAGDRSVGLLSGGRATAGEFVDPFATSIPSTTRGPSTSWNWGVGGTVTGKLGAVNVKSISAYRKMNRHLRNLDQDGTPYDILQLDSNLTTQHQFSQELQLFSDALDERLSWIVGGYYFSEKGGDLIHSKFLYPAIIPTVGVTHGDVANKSYAAYAQLTFDLTERLSAVGGIRYTKDVRNLTLYNRTETAEGAVVGCVTSGGVAPGCRVQAPRAKFDYIPFEIGLNYQINRDVLFYGKWSRGFRSGGFNLRAADSLQILPFGPERLDSYEAGAKIDIDRLLRVNIAAFHSKFNDIQFNATRQDSSGGTTTIVANAGKAQINGVELEATAILGDLTLSGNIGLTDARYKKLNPGVVGLTLESEFQLTPEVTYGAAADYALPATFGHVRLHADYSWRAHTAYALVPPSDSGNIAPAYALLNAKVAVDLKNGLEASIWGRNIADKKYFGRVQNLQSLGVISAFPGDPRTYGITLGYRF